MKTLRLSRNAQRDFEEIVAAWHAFKNDLRTPWTFIPGLIVAGLVAFFMMLPWLTD